MLAFYNWDSNELKLLSIPRDTYVQLPGKKTKTKINEAYFYGGMALLESTIEHTFGIVVNHWVEVDFAGFLNMIDALGGVEIDVPYRMYKPTEEINIQKGPQTLYGYDALAFVRYRGMPTADIGRIQNQQMFLRAVAAKIAHSSLLKAPQLVTIGMEHTTTNYTLTDALMLGAALYKTDLTNIPMYSLPGTGLYIGKTNYWILNKKSTIEIITEITGGELGEFNIINDGGMGSVTAPKGVEDDTVEDDTAKNSEEDQDDDLDENEGGNVNEDDPAAVDFGQEGELPSPDNIEEASDENTPNPLDGEETAENPDQQFVAPLAEPVGDDVIE
jgi:LCP family protein required for cell wall assembly